MIKRLGLFLNILLFIGSSAIFAQVAPDCVTAVPICNNTPVNGGLPTKMQEYTVEYDDSTTVLMGLEQIKGEMGL